MTTVTTRYESGRLIATIIGDVTLLTMTELLLPFSSLSAQAERDILIDLMAVPKMDPAGAGMLAALAERLTPRGLEVHLTCPQPDTERLLKDLGVTKVAPIEYYMGPYSIH